MVVLKQLFSLHIKHPTSLLHLMVWMLRKAVSAESTREYLHRQNKYKVWLVTVFTIASFAPFRYIVLKVCALLFCTLEVIVLSSSSLNQVPLDVRCATVARFVRFNDGLTQNSLVNEQTWSLTYFPVHQWTSKDSETSGIRYTIKTAVTKNVSFFSFWEAGRWDMLKRFYFDFNRKQRLVTAHLTHVYLENTNSKYDHFHNTKY